MSASNRKSTREIEAELEQTRSRIGGTIDTLEDRLAPEQMIARGMEYLRHNGSTEFASNLGASVRSNPLPVSLAAIGIGWLMFNGRRGDGLSRNNLRNSEQRRSTPGGANDQAGNSLANVGRSAANAAQRTQDDMNRMGQGASEQARRARSEFSRFLDEQPLMVGALGIALGAALGTSLPASQTEDEWVGGVSDEIKNETSRTVKRQSEKASPESNHTSKPSAGPDQHLATSESVIGRKKERDDLRQPPTPEPLPREGSTGADDTSPDTPAPPPGARSTMTPKPGQTF